MKLTNTKKTVHISKINESFIEACERGLQDAALYLIEMGADVESVIDKTGQTPIVIASKTGNSAIARLLIDYGADVNMPDGLGHTPLEWACMEGHAKIARLLLENGADPIEINPDPEAVKPFNEEILALLREYVRQETGLGEADGMGM